jgi:mannitol-1-phosphate 5-dehydrogenase
MLPPELQSIAGNMAGYPEAVIGRMVPIQTVDMKDGDPLRICVEKYAFLPVDKAAFKGDIPNITGMIPLDNFEYYVKRKLFIHNLGHAAVAYLGLLKGYKYIAEAADDADILIIAKGAMRESAAALNCENAGDAANLSRHIDSLIYRFSNRQLGDTCARVAADPIRKLGNNDRIIGSLRNCEKYGLSGIYISAIAAAAAITLEKTYKEGGKIPALSEITGLAQESGAYRLIMLLGTICAAAAQRNADAVKVLRRACVKNAGDITIL